MIFHVKCTNLFVCFSHIFYYCFYTCHMYILCVFICIEVNLLCVRALFIGAHTQYCIVIVIYHCITPLISILIIRLFLHNRGLINDLFFTILTTLYLYYLRLPLVLVPTDHVWALVYGIFVVPVL